MSLPPRTDPDDWAQEIAEDAEGEMTGEVAYFDPDHTTVIPYLPGPPESGGYSVLKLLFTTKARIAILQAPRDPSNALAYSTKRIVQIQHPINASTMLIRKGLIVRVLNGGDDPVLLKVAMTVQSALNGSKAAVRTVVCVTELSETPPIEVP